MNPASDGSFITRRDFLRQSAVAGATGVALNSALAEEIHSVEEVGRRPMLVANYYVWYRSGTDPKEPFAGWVRPERQRNLPTPDSKFGPADEPRIASTAYPLIGLYDSKNTDVAQWHVKLAKAAGIQAFLVDWWGTHKDRDQAWEGGILAAAEQCNFKVALLDERAQFHSDFTWYKDSLTRAVSRFHHSAAYLRIDSKPVVYLYQIAGKATLTPAKFKELKSYVEAAEGPIYWIVDKIVHDHTAARTGQLDEVKRIPAEWLDTPGIDCFAFYSTFSNFRACRYEDLVGKYRYLTGLAHAAGKKMLLPVHPGHDNSRFNDEPYVMPRRDGQTLRDYLRAAEDAGADIIMITSWNEWPETTVVEPSATWQDPYQYLKILTDWRGLEFPESPPELPRTQEGTVQWR